MSLENKGTPVLSFCIPTYNRAEYLRQCLDAIVGQECFDERVEIVISDNCSTDDTQRMSLEYQEKYPNIRYFRNEENLIDGNFPLSLQRATGLLRKMTNDTLIYQPGAVKRMLEIAEEYADTRPQVYFLNSGRLQPATKEVKSLDEYVAIISYNLTSIAPLAIWEDDCDDLHIFTEKAKTKQAQVYFEISNFEKRGSAVINDDIIQNALEPRKKDLTYGVFRVFYTTFTGILRECADAGKISETCFQKVRKDLLLDFLSKWTANQIVQKDKYHFSDENLKELIEKEYGNEPYFNEYQKRLRERLLRERVKRMLRK